jgi:hypothetical protein
MQVLWSDLTPEEKCVVVCAIEECDLSALLYMRDPHWTQQRLPDLTLALAQAVLSLFDKGMIEVFPSDPTSSATSLKRDQVSAVVSNPRAWWNGDEGLEVVVWLVFSDDGDAVLAGLSKDDMYEYGRSDRAG